MEKFCVEVFRPKGTWNGPKMTFFQILGKTNLLKTIYSNFLHDTTGAEKFKIGLNDFSQKIFWWAFWEKSDQKWIFQVL